MDKLINSDYPGSWIYTDEKPSLYRVCNDIIDVESNPDEYDFTTRVMFSKAKRYGYSKLEISFGVLELLMGERNSEMQTV